jgi:hypothetical protein
MSAFDPTATLESGYLALAGLLYWKFGIIIIVGDIVS